MQVFFFPITVKEYVKRKMYGFPFLLLFLFSGLQLSMQEHALGVEAEGDTLTVLVAVVHVVTGGMYSF